MMITIAIASYWDWDGGLDWKIIHDCYYYYYYYNKALQERPLTTEELLLPETFSSWDFLSRGNCLALDKGPWLPIWAGNHNSRFQFPSQVIFYFRWLLPVVIISVVLDSGGGGGHLRQQIRSSSKRTASHETRREDDEK